MTLVEVLAASAVLGILLTGVLISESRLSRQAYRARRRVTACELADTLLLEWSSTKRPLPTTGEGQVPGHAGWRWEVRKTGDAQARAHDLVRVELSVYGPVALDQSHPGGPDVTVEYVVPR